MERVIITGGNGFIGSHIVRQFCLKGIKVVCLIRKDADRTLLSDCEVEFAEVEYGDQSQLNNLIRDADCLIHNAAYARDWGDYSLFYESNVETTIRVLRSAIDNHIPHVIMTSSCSVYGEEDYNGVKDESYPYHSHYPYFLDAIFPSAMNHYRDSKTIAEKTAISMANDHHLNLTVMQPVWVFGEGERHAGFYEYLCSARSIRLFLPGSKENRFHCVYVKDLANAYFLAYRKRLGGVHRLIIGNRVADKMEDIYTLFCREVGIAKPRNLPKWLIYPVGLILEFLYTLFRSKNPPLLTRARVNMFYDNIEYSVKTAKETLGFENSYTLEEGIRNTVRWYRENHWL